MIHPQLEETSVREATPSAESRREEQINTECRDGANYYPNLEAGMVRMVTHSETQWAISCSTEV